MKRKKKVLILGAGLAGFNAALGLRKARQIDPDAEITLIDQHNYHLFPLLLFQVATGGVEPRHISVPVRSRLRKQHVNFAECSVGHIDLEHQKVNTDRGNFEWDHLVIALGSTTNFFGATDCEKNALTLKSLPDALKLYSHIVNCYEAAALETDRDRRRELLTFVLAGGGGTGVELAASIQDLARKIMRKDYGCISPDDISVILAEGKDRLLSEMDQRMSDIALRRLRSQGTEVQLNARIAGMTPSSVHTTDGRAFSCRTMIWVAGIKPVKAVDELPLEKKGGRIVVNDKLQVPTSPQVYVVGDCASSMYEGAPLPPTGQVAAQQGEACAGNILKALAGQPQEPFTYHHKGYVVSLGENAAIAQLAGRTFHGFPAWLLSRSFYLTEVVGWRNKSSLALDWWNTFLRNQNTSRQECCQDERERRH